MTPRPESPSLALGLREWFTDKGHATVPTTIATEGRAMVSWHIDTPLTVGPFELRGRVYLPAHQPGLAEGGQVTDRYIAYHRARAKAGVAMQVTGATPVAPSAEWADICLWNIDESIVPGYQRLAAAVRAEGGRMVAQLAHPGPTETEGPDVIGPSRDFSEVARQVVVPATAGQIDLIVQQYAEAADRCRRGELDGIEISMAHGLLLASFISPLTNHRDDQYGGTFERRLALPIRILDAVREVIGTDMMLGIRLGVDDLVEGGLRPDEAALVAQALESRVDYISVMVGNNNRFEARVRHWPPTPARPGLFRDVARVITQAVSKPVAAVGRITTLALANDLIDAGDTDMVGMVRAQIADAELIPLSRAGRESEVRPCIGINACTNALLAQRPLECAVNPDVATPGDPTDPDDLAGHRSVVVGGGPAGLEAARRLATRGSSVTLIEAGASLGGRVGQWSTAPSRREVGKYLAWQRRQLAALGVDVRLGTRASAREVLALGPDTVVIATGAPAVATAGLESDGSVEVLTADHAFDGTPSGRVVVFDEIGNLDGALIADHLRAEGAQVTLVTSRLHLGEGEGINSLYPMIRTLAEAGVHVIERRRPVRIHHGDVELEGIFGETGTSLAADYLVTWSGGEPDTALRDEMSAAGIETLVIGDALRPRRFVDATGDAKRVIDAVETSGHPHHQPVGA